MRGWAVGRRVSSVEATGLGEGDVAALPGMVSGSTSLGLMTASTMAPMMAAMTSATPAQRAGEISGPSVFLGPLGLLVRRVVAAGFAEAGIHGGVVVWVNGEPSPNRWAEALATLHERHGTLVLGLHRDADVVASTRTELALRGKNGPVVVERLVSDAIPMIDDSVNLLIVDGAGRVSEQEIQRVLVPNGRAMLPDGSRELVAEILTRPIGGFLGDRWARVPGGRPVPVRLVNFRVPPEQPPGPLHAKGRIDSGSEPGGIASAGVSSVADLMS